MNDECRMRRNQNKMKNITPGDLITLNKQERAEDQVDQAPKPKATAYPDCKSSCSRHQAAFRISLRTHCSQGSPETQALPGNHGTHPSLAAALSLCTHGKVIVNITLVIESDGGDVEGAHG